jgi:hypothetical protein
MSILKGIVPNYGGTGTSPLERAILTHYWCHPTPYKGGSENWAPAETAAVEYFLARKLLKFVPNTDKEGTLGYHIEANRDAIEPYMGALAAVPLPVQKWVVPDEPV